MKHKRKREIKKIMYAFSVQRNDARKILDFENSQPEGVLTGMLVDALRACTLKERRHRNEPVH